MNRFFALALLLGLASTAATAASAQTASEEAAAALETFLERRPGDEEALDRLLAHYDRLKRPEDAIAALARFVGKKPEHVEKSRDLAYRLAQVERLDEAASVLETLLERAPGSKEAWWELIYNYEDRKRYEKTAEVLERYLDRFPNEEKAVELLDYAAATLKRPGLGIARLEAFVAARPEHDALSERLAERLAALGRVDDAAAVRRRLLERGPERADRWRSLIYLLSDNQRAVEAIEVLRGFRRRFPEDGEGLQLLASLLTAEGRRAEAIAVLRPAADAAPEISTRTLTLLGLLVDEKRYDEAETVLLSRHEREPAEALWVERLAQIYSWNGRSEDAALWYGKLASLRGDDPEDLKRSGTHSFYAGRYGEAERSLSLALEKGGEDPEILFLLAEIAFARGDAAKGRKLGARSLKRLPMPGAPRDQYIRVQLESRVRWTPEVEKTFASLAQAMPDEHDVLEAWIEGLLFNGRAAAAGRPIALHERRFPERGERRSLYRYRAAEAGRDWNAALSLFGAARKAEPGDAWLGVPLAEGLLAAGRYEDARRILCSETREDALAGCFARTLHGRLHDEGDASAGGGFRYAGFSGDALYEERASLRLRPAARWSVNTDATLGTYRSDPASSNHTLAILETKAAYAGESPFSAGGGVEISAGAPRDAFSPSLFGQYRPSHRLRLRGDFSWARLWNEFAAPVAAGGLESAVSLSAEGSPYPRWTASAAFARRGYALGDASRATRHDLSWSLSRTVLEGGSDCGKPLLSLGYRSAWEKVHGDAGFFARVPMALTSHAHCANGYYEQRFLGGTLRATAGSYLCADGERSIGFGELWGADAGVRWTATSRLNAMMNYSYGRESALGAVGQSHAVRIALEARWEGKGL
jgi:tetratricopeptide (TPR) repeat protein